MVSISKIESGIAKYLDDEVMTKLPGNGFEKILTGTALSLMIRRITTQFDTFKVNPYVKMMGIISDDGLVDVELVAEELKKHIPAGSGIKIDIPFIGAMTFHRPDVDCLLGYILEKTIVVNQY